MSIIKLIVTPFTESKFSSGGVFTRGTHPPFIGVAFDEAPANAGRPTVSLHR